MKMKILIFFFVLGTKLFGQNTKATNCDITFDLRDFDIQKNEYFIEIYKWLPDSLESNVLWKRFIPKKAFHKIKIEMPFPQEVNARLIIKDSIVSRTPNFYVSNEAVIVEFKDRFKASSNVKSIQNNFLNENRALFMAMPALIANFNGFSYKRLRQYYDINIPDLRLLEYYLREYESTIIRQVKLYSNFFFTLVRLEEYKQQFTIKTLDTCYAILEQKFPGTNTLKKLQSYIAQSKKIQPGKRLLSFKCVDTSGAVNISDSIYSKKEYTLIDFWASWCGPCRVEMSKLKKQSNVIDTTKFQIVSISIDDDKIKWLKAIKDDKINWANYIDIGGWQSNVAKTFNITFIPKNFLVDREGKIMDFDIRSEKLLDFLKVKNLINR